MVTWLDPCTLLSPLAYLSLPCSPSLRFNRHTQPEETYGDNSTPYEGEFLSIRRLAPQTLTELSNSTSYDRRSIFGHDFKTPWVKIAGGSSFVTVP